MYICKPYIKHCDFENKHILILLFLFLTASSIYFRITRQSWRHVSSVVCTTCIAIYFQIFIFKYSTSAPFLWYSIVFLLYSHISYYSIIRLRSLVNNTRSTIIWIVLYIVNYIATGKHMFVTYSKYLSKLMTAWTLSLQLPVLKGLKKGFKIILYYLIKLKKNIYMFLFYWNKETNIFRENIQ